MMTSLAKGYRALVIGSSGGIGSAIVRALEADDNCSQVIGLSRSTDGLDITDEASVEDAVRQLDGEFQLIFCATGALTIDGIGPEKALKQLSPDAMMRQFALNALGPALVLKHFGGRLPKRERGLMAFLSARVGSISDNHLGGWISYRASKAALNQIIRTASIELGRTHPLSVLAALHPGTVATALTDDYSSGRERFRPEDSASKMLAVLDGLQTQDSGAFFAYDGSRIDW
ncbi:SDR family NAD(P)-dependent oxidoreductase [Agrobacterium larrymoorei]|uniref:SDR family NAD(P)-dependent oxidoreductase n=1 Tax=Agrobacterium larrymoorei TaxID=160699 RepID=UPI0030BDEAB2